MRSKLYYLNFLFSLGYNSVSKILPAFLASVTSSAFQIGIVNSAYQLGRGLSTVFSGYVSDRLGKNKSIILAFALTSMLSFMLVFANSIPFFALIFFFIGLVASLFYLSANALTSILSEKRGESLSTLEMSYQAGFVLAPAIGGALAVLLGMPSVFIAWTLVSAIGLAVSISMPKQENEKVSVRKAVGSVFHTLKSRFWEFTVFILAGSFFIGLVEGFRDLIIPLYALDLGFTILDIGLIFAFSSVITIIGIKPLGKVSDKLGRGFSLLLGMFLVCFSFYFLLYANSFILLAILTGILSLGRTIGLVSSRAFASDCISVNTRATGMSLFEIFFAAGKVIGPLSAGLLKDIISIEGVFLSFFAVSVGLTIIVGGYYAFCNTGKFFNSS